MENNNIPIPAETYTRVYLISNNGEVIGIKTPKTPRRKKKRLKASGLYLAPHIAGFDISKLLTGPDLTLTTK